MCQPYRKISVIGSDKKVPYLENELGNAQSDFAVEIIEDCHIASGLCSTEFLGIS